MSFSEVDRVWFYFAREKQVGPISEVELRAAVSENLLTINDYVYCEGFADWKVLRDLPEMLMPPAPPARGPAGVPKGNPRAAAALEQEKRSAAQRVPLDALIIAHNDRYVATGSIRNISLTGLFFETEQWVFNLKDEVKITLKEGRGLGKPMHLRGVIVRKATDAKFPKGYGLELREMDELMEKRIAEYVKRNAKAG